MLISGAIFFLLSPLSFFVPKFLSNPFGNLNAPDVLSSFGAIAICALILGVAFYALEGYVVGGENGFNKRVRNFLKKTPVEPAVNWLNRSVRHFLKKTLPEDKKEENKEIDPAFYGWIKSNDIINEFHDFIFLKDSVIKGLLLGFEVSFFFNLFFSLFLYWLPSFAFETAVKIIISLGLSFSVFLYDKLLWKPSRNRAMNDLYKTYLSERIPIA